MHEGLRDFGPRRGCARGEGGVAEHADEQVVEVVGHPACEHAQALELLRVEHLRFEGAAFFVRLPPPGDVAGGPQDRRWAFGNDAGGEPHFPPVDIEAVLELLHLAGAQRRIDDVLHPRGRLDREHLVDRPPQELVRRQHQTIPSGENREVAPLVVEAQQHVRRVVEDVPVLLVPLLQDVLEHGVFATVNEEHRARGIAGLVEERNDIDDERVARAALAGKTDERPPLRDARLENGLDRPGCRQRGQDVMHRDVVERSAEERRRLAIGTLDPPRVVDQQERPGHCVQELLGLGRVRQHRSNYSRAGSQLNTSARRVSPCRGKPSTPPPCRLRREACRSAR